MSSKGPGRRPLEGRGIVITRPRDQAEALGRLILEYGGVPIVFPAIDILDVEDPSRLHALIDRLEIFDLAVFISPNAAIRGLRAILARRALPPLLKMAAIGQGSASALERHAIQSVIVPRSAADSEALLDVPALREVKGQRIVIFRGEGGRAVLGETLAARGASVEYAECYRRVKPQSNVRPVLEACARGEVDAFVATSSEGLRNVCDILGEAGRPYLERTALFVPHARIASTARALGLASVFVTDPGDAGLARAIAERLTSP